MAAALDKKAIFIQNLIDAGCSQETLEICTHLLEEGKQAELLKKLSDGRKKLLRKVHDGQKQIDCLDFLVYQIKKGNYQEI